MDPSRPALCRNRTGRLRRGVARHRPPPGDTVGGKPVVALTVVLIALA
ncbi:MAG: hypothetical protein JWM67_962 [Mycobacterium sp.]|nr:hypothetical protein [Mycobacterium sp.]